MYARNHNVFRLGIAEIEYVVDHLFFIRLDYTIFMADIHNGTKFFFCHSFIRRIRIYAKDQHDSAGKQVNDENDRSHDRHEKLDDRNIAKGKLLSVDRCIILRCNLSKYKDCHCQNQCSNADHVSTKWIGKGCSKRRCWNIHNVITNQDRTEHLRCVILCDIKSQSCPLVPTVCERAEFNFIHWHQRSLGWWKKWWKQ